MRRASRSVSPEPFGWRSRSDGHQSCSQRASNVAGVERAEHVADGGAATVVEHEGVLRFEHAVRGGVELAEEPRVADQIGGVSAGGAGAQADLVEPVEVARLVRPDPGRHPGQRPVQVGRRFSRNAWMPSWASSVAAFSVITLAARV